MDWQTLLQTRRSVREFTNQEVSHEIIEEILSYAATAPTAGNRQDWEFLVLETPEIKEAVVEKTRAAWRSFLVHTDSGLAEEIAGYIENSSWFGKSPVVIVVLCKKVTSWLSSLLGASADKVGGSYHSACMAAENLMLAAHGKGLGTCCLTGPLLGEMGLREILDISQRYSLVCCVVLGYPKQTPEAPEKRLPVVRYL